MTDLIEKLTADLRPVARRRPGRELAALVVLAVVEVILYVALGGMRADMDAAMVTPAFWWKAASLAVLAAVSTATVLASLDPSRSPRRGLRLVGLVTAVAVGAGWAIDAAGAGGAALLDRLMWRDGIDCLFAVVALSLPPIVALGLMIRRGAPVDPARTAAAAGVTAAAWGGLIFVVRCPHDDPFYVAFWFAASILLVMLAARVLLPRLIRW